MRVEVEPLKPGVAGVEQTVRHITRMIREGASNPLVIDEARRAVRRARPHDTAAEWRELWNYVTGLQGWPYRYDPVDVEWTQAATRGGVAGGDCDDFAVRCGALLEALGYPVQVEVAGQQGKDGPIWHHVYVVAQDPRTGKWSAFDPSVTDRPGQRKGKPGDRLMTDVQQRYPLIQPSVLQTYRPLGGASRLGYSADEVHGYTPLGGPFDFLKTAASAITKVTDTVYNSVLKHVDPTRQENAGIREAISLIPGASSGLTVLDKIADANVKYLQPAIKAIDSMPSASSGLLSEAQVLAAYQQAFGHGWATPERRTAWLNYVRDQKVSSAADLLAQMAKPVYDSLDQRAQVTVASPVLLSEAQVLAAYQQAFGHGWAPERRTAWLNYVRDQKVTSTAALLAQMSKPVYDSLDQRASGSKAPELVVLKEAPPLISTSLPTSPPLMTQLPTSPVLAPPAQPATQTGMSTGLKIGLGFGGVAAVGGLVWGLTKKPKRRRARRR